MKRRKLSIRILLPLVMSIAIALCIITCLFMFSRYLLQYIEYSAEREVERQKEALALGIEREVERMNDIVNNIYYQNIKSKDFKYFTGELDNYIEDNTDIIYGIEIFDMEGDNVWSSSGEKCENIKSEGWYNDTLTGIETIHFGNEEVVYDADVRKVVPAARYIEYSGDGSINQGILCVEFYSDSIDSVIDSYGSTYSEYCYMTDENDDIIYHPFNRAIESHIYEEKTIKDINNISGYNIINYLNKKWIIEKQQIGYTGWKIIVVNSLSDIRNNSLNIFYILWMILLLVGMFLIVLDIILFRKFTNPIYKLLHTMEEFGRGNYEIKADEGGTGELNNLSCQFNIMADKLHQQMDEIRKNEHEKRKMEKKLLQSQINPHFLYNTLDSVIWMIESGEYSGAEEMVSLLAKFFRVSLSRGDDIISLEKELEHATSYLAIQNIRFKDKFEFNVDADKRLLCYMCPKLVIQPLLENAIYHGMDGKYDDGEISINIYERNKKIYIDVVDNGLGMSAEQVDYIMHNKVVSGKRGSGIGVKNVDERIKLIYGDEYGVEIISEPDEGTTARIIIPEMEEIDDK